MGCTQMTCSSSGRWFGTRSANSRYIQQLEETHNPLNKRWFCFRQLVLDGQWDEVLQFIQPLEFMEKFDRRRCVWCASHVPS